jgi:Kazal-type serine protease inhibitor-like protein
MKIQWASGWVIVLASIWLAVGSLPAFAQTCPTTSSPVCAVSADGTRSVYTNECLADAAKARVLHPGNCQGPICMELYLPVCATNPTTQQPQTYSNQCFADVANAKVISQGACN